jgi:cytochrome P450
VVTDRSLLPQAIEEGIRWETPLLNFMRETTRDIEFFGAQIPEGSTMSVNLGSANHDESRWDEPESFDIFRERKPHIGFGHGAHVCLGMHLARLESTDLQHAVRLAARASTRSRRADAVHRRHLLPLPAAPQGDVGLIAVKRPDPVVR